MILLCADGLALRQIAKRKVTKNGNFTSRTDIVDKFLAFITDYDTTARPFKWTYAADPLKVLVA